MNTLLSFDEFELDDALQEKKLFIANPDAQDFLECQPFYKEMKEDDDGNLSSSYLTKAISYLKSEGFTEPIDFKILESLNEALEVKFSGLKENILHITIGGHDYGYEEKQGGTKIQEIARKFEKMLTFSTGRALDWLKKNAQLATGSKKTK